MDAEATRKISLDLVMAQKDRFTDETDVQVGIGRNVLVHQVVDFKQPIHHLTSHIRNAGTLPAPFFGNMLLKSKVLFQHLCQCTFEIALLTQD